MGGRKDAAKDVGRAELEALSKQPGQQLLHYRLTEQIGEGGMGVVWKAVDTTLDREAAIKVLPPAFTADPERLARFDREAKLLASLNHAHIAGIYGAHEKSSCGGATGSATSFYGESTWVRVLRTTLVRGVRPL